VSTCVLCKRPIGNGEFMVDGYPAVVGWVPPGTPSTSVYAIVTAHLRCCGVLQLRQALECWEQDRERDRKAGHGYRTPAAIEAVVARRLSELLARGVSDNGASPPKADGTEGTRFSLLEVD
jgi:hypothetical protein